MVDINSSGMIIQQLSDSGNIQMLEPIAKSIGTIIGTLQYLVGGVFGLYVILLIVRIIEARKLNRTYKAMLRELVQLNSNFKNHLVIKKNENKRR